MTERQRTIQREVSVRGTGVHTGAATRVTLKPAPPDSGVVFIRKDLHRQPVIPASVRSVTGTARGTSLSANGAEVRTVEHLLAALAGFKIDNLIVEMDGPEPPLGDGSALIFSRLLQDAGWREEKKARRYFSPLAPVQVGDGKGMLIALPGEELKIAFTIAFDDAQLGAQYLALTITPEVFEKELAPARTFGFYREALPLLEKGLIKASGLENTVVIGDDAVFSQGGLRFRDECVRHKILDLCGDLFLLGQPLRALVVAIRSGHALNIALVKKLVSTSR